MKPAKRRIGRRFIGLLAMMVSSAGMGLYFAHAAPAAATAPTAQVSIQTFDSCRQALGGAQYLVTGPGFSTTVATPFGKPQTINGPACPLPAGNCVATSGSTTETSTLTSTQQSAVSTSTGISTTSTSFTATGTTTVTTTNTKPVTLGTLTGCTQVTLPAPASGTADFTIQETVTPPPDSGNAGYAPCSGGSACHGEVATVTVDSTGTVLGWTTVSTSPDGSTAGTTWKSASLSPGSPSDPVLIHDFGLAPNPTIDPCPSGVTPRDGDADDYLTGTPSSSCAFAPENQEGINWCTISGANWGSGLQGVAFPWACAMSGNIAHVGVSMDTNSLTADGRSTAMVTATVTDNQGAAVPNVPVTFSATDGSIGSPMTTDSFGHAISTLTVGTKVGNQSVTARAANVSGSASFTTTAPASGYYMDASDGGIFAFGLGAPFYGSMGGQSLNAPIIGMAAVPNGGGYWEVASDGGLFAFGPAAKFYGSMGGRPLNAPIVGMAATGDGRGYYLVASDGGIFAYGNAAFYGSMGGKPLNKPIVGIAVSPKGGYWEVASDGGIFAFGPGAGFYGSMGGKPLNAPIVTMASTGNGQGYWMTASDGGIFAFGNAPFHGSMGGKPLNKPIVGMDATRDGKGYWLVASDGGIFAFNAPFFGSMGGQPLAAPIVGMTSAT